MEKLGTIIFKTVPHHEECVSVRNKSDFCDCEAAPVISELINAVKAYTDGVIGSNKVGEDIASNSFAGGYNLAKDMARKRAEEML